MLFLLDFMMVKVMKSLQIGFSNVLNGPISDRKI